MSDLIIIKAKVKDFSENYNVSSDLIPALNSKVKVLLREAIDRAKANGRKTVMAKDL